MYVTVFLRVDALLQRKSPDVRNGQAVRSVDWDITYHSSRYSSLAADTKNVPFMFMQCLSKSLHLARLTFLMLSQGAGHFRKADIGHVAHSSTGGSEVPAYDKCYILATDIYVIMFRAVYI